MSAHFGIEQLRVRGFRSVRDATLRPPALCALVGEANAGKSNLLAAVRALLDPGAPAVTDEDRARDGDGVVRIEADIRSGESLVFEDSPGRDIARSAAGAPSVLFLPAALRSGSVVAAPVRRGAAGKAAELLGSAFAAQVAPHDRDGSATAPALSFLHGLESCCAFGVTGVVLLVEEPELYLRPQAQRYLYRLLRRFADGGNQVIYSTHAPAFLNVARLEELALVEHHRKAGTRIVQPEPLPATKDFRALSEFDSERSELFLARAALLVEGRTEKLVFPFVFEALGHDPDQEAISIVECGGKGNLPLFIRICQATGIPYVVVHDRDAQPGRDPLAGERERNALIAELAGDERTIVLEPDFEGVAGLRGRSHKPQRALERFRTPGAEVPGPLARAAELVLALARD
ncbi:MAG: TOPRIM nucleotidyl transferase/hydrolase domain-containing protein [Gaiellaceae bacterium]